MRIITMSKIEQVLSMDPGHELQFKGPFTEVSTSKLKLSNPSESRVCFKVKTTAPKMYCVRPNSGLIEPGQSITISVMLQPVPNFDYSEKCRHKFMVQTMYAPDTHFESQEALWKDADPETLMASRLRCVFSLPELQNDRHTSDDDETSIDTVVKNEVKRDLKPESITSQSDDSTLFEENRRLKNEITQLMAQIEKAKAQEVRMRKMAVEDTVSSTPSPSLAPHTSQTSPTTIPSIIYLLAALILGLIIGKLIF